MDIIYTVLELCGGGGRNVAAVKAVLDPMEYHLYDKDEAALNEVKHRWGRSV